MLPLSFVITTPDGVSHCLPLRQIAAQEGHEDVEIIVADCSGDGPTGDAPPGVRHLRMPGASLFSLRRAAIASAKHDWVVITEDHCNLLPGYFSAYRDAIRERPDIDLFSGAVVNASRPTPSSMANYFFGYCEHWPESRSRPTRAAIANLAVRRSAITEADLALDGGFEFHALARLAQSSRYAQCPRALVDHVQNGTLIECCQGHFRNGRNTSACWGLLRRESAWNAAWRWFRHVIAAAILRPLFVMQSLRGVYPAYWSIVPRLFLLGTSHALGATLGLIGGSRGSDRKHD